MRYATLFHIVPAWHSLLVWWGYYPRTHHNFWSGVHRFAYNTFYLQWVFRCMLDSDVDVSTKNFFILVHWGSSLFWHAKRCLWAWTIIGRNYWFCMQKNQWKIWREQPWWKVSLCLWITPWSCCYLVMWTLLVCKYGLCWNLEWKWPCCRSQREMVPASFGMSKATLSQIITVSFYP